MFCGPWHARSTMCAIGEAGVASVSSEVVTFPVRRPSSWASSRIVVRSSSSGEVEIRPSTVFSPVDYAVDVDADSDV